MEESARNEDAAGASFDFTNLSTDLFTRGPLTLKEWRKALKGCSSRTTDCSKDDKAIFQPRYVNDDCPKHRRSRRDPLVYELSFSDDDDFDRSDDLDEHADQCDENVEENVVKISVSSIAREERSGLLNGKTTTESDVCSTNKTKRSALRKRPSQKRPIRTRPIRRRVPLSNELVLGPTLSAEPEPTVQRNQEDVFEDTIEETQAFIQSNSARSPVCSPQYRFVSSMSTKIRLSPHMKSTSADHFNFAKMKKFLPRPNTSGKHAVRDGFDENEIKFAPRGREVRRRSLAEKTDFMSLTLGALGAEPAIKQPPSSDGIHMSCYDQENRFPQNDVHANLNHGPQRAHFRKRNGPTLSGASKVKRKVFSSNEIVHQLRSLMAPVREYSDSEDEDALAEDNELDMDAADEAGDSPEEIEHMPHTKSEPPIQYEGRTDHQNMNIDDMNVDEIESPRRVAADPNKISKRAEFLTQPGQAQRMKTSGRWNEAGEDIVDVDNSPVCQKRDQQLTKSILKSSTRSESTLRALGTSMMLDYVPFAALQSTRRGPDTLMVPANKEPSYFTQATQRIASQHVRRHSIVPRREKRNQAQDFYEDEDDDEDESMILRSDEVRNGAHHFNSLYSIYAGVINHLSPLRPASPTHDLKKLARRTSQEFGTISSRPRRKPSLPFIPPFFTSKVANEN